MAMKSIYKLSIPSVLFYYNILGIDIREIDLNYIETEVENLEELTPAAVYYSLPKTSKDIDYQMHILLGTLCTSFGYSEEGELFKENYYRSVIGILNTVTSLNLLQEESCNYTLHFNRLNYIINQTLISINSLSPDRVIRFYKLILNHDIKSILKLASILPILSLLTCLALAPNQENNDYDMFDENSSEIDLEKLSKLVTKNSSKEIDFMPNSDQFMRLSYKASQELSVHKN